MKAGKLIMFPKIEYEVVYLGLDILFRKEIDCADENAVNDHHAFIREFVEACGWETEAFTLRMMNQAMVN